MRVLQLIDSLRPGGAEKMAVNIANALLPHVDKSYLCCTRQEGLLKNELKTGVGYLFLEKSVSLDLKAIIKLRKYIKENHIEIVHAHGTSFFFGFLVKFLFPKLNLKLIWHDHYGNRAYEKINNHLILFICSNFFDGIITVNKELSNWASSNLLSKNVKYIPNFVLSDFTEKFTENLNEQVNPPNLVYVANLKKPKNHINLLNAFCLVVQNNTNCKLILIGKKYGDQYEENIKDFIYKNHLENHVILTGEEKHIYRYLKYAAIGLITSDYEGLPMALLEYGMAGVAVISTDVGACADIIGTNGKIVDPNDPIALSKKILFYLKNDYLRNLDAGNFHQFVLENFSEDIIIEKIINFYNSSTKIDW